MLTSTVYARMAGHYAADWETTPNNPHRLSSDPRAGLAEWLRTHQRGLCAFCGEGEAVEICHVFPGGPRRLGWTAGNLALGCRACNEADAGNVVTLASVMRPDLVPDEWPDVPELAAIGRDVKRRREAERDRVREIRGMV